MVPISLFSVWLWLLGCREFIQKDVRPDSCVVLTPVVEPSPRVLPINLGEKRRCSFVSKTPAAPLIQVIEILTMTCRMAGMQAQTIES